MTGDARRATARGDRGGEDADGRRLARAVGAEQAEDFATAHVEADAFDRLDAAGVDLAQVAHLDGRVVLGRFAVPLRRCAAHDFASVVGFAPGWSGSMNKDEAARRDVTSDLATRRDVTSRRGTPS